MKRLIFLTILVCVAGASNLALARNTTSELVCQSDESAWLSTTLFFGRSISKPAIEDGEVSDDQWKTFRDDHITPRLSNGYTLIDGKGHWKNSDTGELKAEKSKILIVVHPRDQDFEDKLGEIIEAYKSSFNQQSVLRSVSAVCIKF